MIHSIVRSQPSVVTLPQAQPTPTPQDCPHGAEQTFLPASPAIVWFDRITV